MRNADAGLALAGPAEIFRADLFTFTLQNGIVYRWTSWQTDIADNWPAGTGLLTFASSKPWLGRGKWNVRNTMVVGTLDVTLLANNAAFEGGANIKAQLHNGLFDGAAVDLQYLYMTTPGVTSTFNPVDIFTGVVGAIQIVGGSAKITVKSKVNILDQQTPRHVYQTGCNHAFCDAGCTLSRISYTASYTVGSSPAPSRTLIPWSSAPSNPGRYLSGTVTFTSGAADGEETTIAKADSTGLTLAYPLCASPAAGDSFTAFEGCDKTYNGVNGAGSVQSCTVRSNTAHYDGFEFTPPPSAAI
jgi:uncharacterized phage protein (TIGR02218 family)